MTKQLHEESERQRAEAIEKERQRLLAESQASQHEIEERAKQEAALALQAAKKKQDEELAHAREEVRGISSSHAAKQDKCLPFS